MEEPASVKRTAFSGPKAGGPPQGRGAVRADGVTVGLSVDFCPAEGTWPPHTAVTAGTGGVHAPTVTGRQSGGGAHAMAAADSGVDIGAWAQPRGSPCHCHLHCPPMCEPSFTSAGGGWMLATSGPWGLDRSLAEAAGLLVEDTVFCPGPPSSAAPTPVRLRSGVSCHQ